MTVLGQTTKAPSEEETLDSGRWEGCASKHEKYHDGVGRGLGRGLGHGPASDFSHNENSGKFFVLKSCFEGVLLAEKTPFNFCFFK